MASHDFILLSGTLSSLFPLVNFFSPRKGKKNKASGKSKKPQIAFEEYEISKLVRIRKIGYQDTEKLAWEMMKSEYFRFLFPVNARENWNELNAKIKHGNCRIIEFFAGKIDRKYLEGLNSDIPDEIQIKDSPVLALFLETVFRGVSLSIFELSEIKKLDICRHSTSSLYRAFSYFARKQYTLIRLAREFTIPTLHDEWKSELGKKLMEKRASNIYLGLIYYYDKDSERFFIDLLENTFNDRMKLRNNESEIDFAWAILFELFINHLRRLREIRKRKGIAIDNPKTPRNKIYYLAKKESDYTFNVIDTIEKILESKPLKIKENSYVPIGFITLSGQISGQLKYLKLLKDHDDFKDFSPSEMKTIGNYYSKLADFPITGIIAQNNSNIDVHDKVRILYNNIRFFSDSQKEIIRGLYAKASPDVQLNEDLDEDENVAINTGYYDEKEINEEREIFSECLKIEFKNDDEIDFIQSIKEEKNWLIISGELIGYYHELKEYENDSFIFRLYRGKRKNATHKPFKSKIIKSIGHYRESYKKIQQREVKNEAEA